MNPIPVAAAVWPQLGALFYLRLLTNLLSSYPYIVSRHYSKAFQTELEKTVAALRPDLIMCEWTPYAIFVKELTHVPRIVVAHNMEQRIWQRYYEHEESALKRWYIGRQMTKVASFERRAFNWVEGAVAVSDAESGEIKTLNPSLPVAVVDNGVDLSYFAPIPDEPKQESLVFVGVMHWRPNQDAVGYFIEEILPLVRQRRPQVSIVVVGQNPPPHIKKLDSLPEVCIVGRVDDVRPYVEAATVYVVPLRIGGGTRLKILEALAMKKAVVSTSVGAEGLDVTDGKNIMLADTAADFAARIELLFSNAELRRQLGNAGRRLVKERYGWDRLADKLEAFLSSLVSVK
ncbi:MAG: glycosyltransferase [Candidatus Eisenbacteria sp.]|nr:glycosyltransferase [Candidatus Eisenbacteria bacterium]